VVPVSQLKADDISAESCELYELIIELHLITAIENVALGQL